MSLICTRYEIKPETFVKMVKDGVIDTDVVRQFEFAETSKQMQTTGMGKEKSIQETARYFGVHRSTIYRALARFK